MLLIRKELRNRPQRQRREIGQRGDDNNHRKYHDTEGCRIGLQALSALTRSSGSHQHIHKRVDVERFRPNAYSMVAKLALSEALTLPVQQKAQARGLSHGTISTKDLPITKYTPQPSDTKPFKETLLTGLQNQKR